MKILLLNPFIDSSHPISAQLKAHGAAVLHPANPDEAWKMIELHGESLDLAIIHREPPTGPGIADKNVPLNLSILEKIKGSPKHADLPLIITSSAWGDSEFAKHQEGSFGANAYQKWPASADDLIQTIDTMFEGQAPWSSVVAEVGTSATTGSGVTAGIKTAPPGGGLSLAAPDATSKITLSVAEATSPAITPATQSSVAQSIVLEEPAQFDISLSASGSASGVSLAFEAPESSFPADAQNHALSVQPVAASSSENELEPHERLVLAANTKSDATSLLPDNNPSNATQVLQFDNPPAEATAQLPSLTPEALMESLEMPPENTGIQGVTSIDIGGQDSASVHAVAGDQSATSAQIDSDESLAADLPYLFGHKSSPQAPQPGLNAQSIVNQVMMFAEPVGDAVVPGGAASSPDVETLKKYLLLREQDVAVLSNQLKSAREQVLLFDKKIKEANGQILELKHVIGEQRRRIDEEALCVEKLVEGLRKENEELSFQLKAKSDKAKVMEAQVRAATEEIDRLKDRVRIDIRKIRVREKELENKLELVRRDSEALIAARESKIIELKRKIDLLEFNLDLLQDQYSREKDGSAQLRDRLGRAAQVVRVAGGLLDTGTSGAAGVADASREKVGSENGPKIEMSGKGENQSAPGVRETA
ncbi:MAG: hypothetical protein P4M08_11515 [Oligoflexia bacterium]|nr:hypothetical protein [Oligoflexia bacterium]